MQYTDILINACVGIIAAFLGSSKPLIDWGIEKKKFKREERKKFVKEVRDLLHGSRPFNRIEFSESFLYIRLKPYLTKKLIEEIEEPYVSRIDVIVKGELTRIYTPLPGILNEVRDLEEKWGLI